MPISIDRRSIVMAGPAGLVAFKSVLLGTPQGNAPGAASGGRLTVRNLRLADDLTIHGSVTNSTDRRWRWASFILRMRDSAGKPIVHDDGFDGHLYVRNIGLKETKPVTNATGAPAKLLLRPAVKPAAVAAEFQPERSYFDSSYVFALEVPRRAQALSYQDETIAVQFKPDKDGLSFTMTNLSRESWLLDWERVVYVDLDGIKHRIIHQEVPLGRKDEKQKPAAINAGAKFTSRVYPADMVAGSRIFEDWRLNPFLPLTQYAPAYRWRTFSVMFPLETPTQTTGYFFSIRIEDVKV